MILPCPACPEEIEVSEEDPDASLSEMWDHVGRHATDRAGRTVLFTEAQKRAREGTP